MAGKYLRGALIEFTESFPLPIPNVIIFQYNPETMTHGWTPATTNPAISTPGASGAATIRWRSPATRRRRFPSRWRWTPTT